MFDDEFIDGQFLKVGLSIACPDFPICENSYVISIAHHPLLRVTVRIAGVINKSAQVSLFRYIDRCISAESNDIDLVDPFPSVGKFTALKFLSIDDLANVLADELIGFQISVCSETTTFLICLKYCYARVLLPLKSSILAVISTIRVVDTLHLGRTVETLRVLPTYSVDFCTVISSHNSVYLWCANSREYG